MTIKTKCLTPLNSFCSGALNIYRPKRYTSGPMSVFHFTSLSNISSTYFYRWNFAKTDLTKYAGRYRRRSKK